MTSKQKKIKFLKLVREAVVGIGKKHADMKDIGRAYNSGIDRKIEIIEEQADDKTN